MYFRICVLILIFDVSVSLADDVYVATTNGVHHYGVGGSFLGTIAEGMNVSQVTLDGVQGLFYSGHRVISDDNRREFGIWHYDFSTGVETRVPNFNSMGVTQLEYDAISGQLFALAGARLYVHSLDDGSFRQVGFNLNGGRDLYFDTDPVSGKVVVADQNGGSVQIRYAEDLLTNEAVDTPLDLADSSRLGRYAVFDKYGNLYNQISDDGVSQLVSTSRDSLVYSMFGLYASPDFDIAGNMIYVDILRGVVAASPDGSETVFRPGNSGYPIDLVVAPSSSFNSVLAVADISGGGVVDVSDVELFSRRLHAGDVDLPDADQDGNLGIGDVASFTKRFAKMAVGDVTHDGRFDSSDLTALFQAGTFEDSVDANADWSTGDWNGDRDFDSSDLVFAMSYGRYEVNSQHAVHVVPEPSTNSFAMILGTYVIGYMRRRHRHISEGPKA